MKKLVASVLTLVMLFSCIPGFATVTPMSGDDTIAKTMYSCDKLTVGGDSGSASFLGGLTAGTPAPEQTANTNGTATIVHKNSGDGDAQKTETYLFFGYNKSTWMDENMSFGFDIKFENVDVEEASKYVMSTNIGANTAQIPDNGSSAKTAWHFYKENSSNMTCYLNSDNEIKMGNAVMEQGKNYTVKVWLNAVEIDAKTFVVTVTDEEGKTQVAIADGEAQNVFQGFGKINFTISPNTKTGAKVTIGNTFVNSDDPYGLGLVADENLAVSDDGTVDVAIRVPSGCRNAKLYVNDALAEEITLTDGTTDYNATINLPEAVTTGEATLKLEAKNGDNTETVTRSVILTRELAVAHKTWNFANSGNYGFANATLENGIVATEDATAAGGYALTFNEMTEVKTADFDECKDGVFESEYEFKTDAPEDMVLRGRFTVITSGEGNGTGLDVHGNGGWFDIARSDGSNGTVKGKIGTETLKADTWYTLKIRVDLKNGEWYYILDGKVVDSGNIGNFSKYQSFKALGVIFNKATIRNLKINRVMSDVPTVTGVVATYENGITADATAKTVSSVNLNKLTFTTSEAITLGTKGAKILDANGNATSATVTASGKEITATYTGSETLSDGAYKLVVCGDATVSGNKLGLAVTKDFTLTTDSIILSPANNSTVSDDTVAISVYVKDAGTMRICVDDEKIYDDFTVNAGETVKQNYTPTANGSKQVQVYIFSGGNVTVLNSAFTVNKVRITNLKNGHELQYGANNSNISEGVSGSLSGRVCWEGDMIPHQTNSKIFFEIGSSEKGVDSTSDGYNTLGDALGYDQDPGIFDKSGKIYKSDIAYQANTTYHIKYVMDYVTDTYELYVDGKLVATKESTATEKSLKAMTNWYSKFRIRITDDGTVDAKNFVAYEEYTVPQITSINGCTLSDGYYPVHIGGGIEIALDKAYAGLDKNNVTLKADGEALDMTEVTVNTETDDKCITLDGYQNLVKKGQILTVTIGESASVSVPDKGTSPTELTYKTVEAGTALEVNLIVLDADNDNDFVVLPLQKVVANGKGYAYCRWINSGSEVNAKLTLADYEDVDANTKRLEKASVKDVTLGGTAGQIGVITGSIDGSVDRAFLWTTDSLTPLTTD